MSDLAKDVLGGNLHVLTVSGVILGLTVVYEFIIISQNQQQKYFMWTELSHMWPENPVILENSAISREWLSLVTTNNYSNCMLHGKAYLTSLWPFCTYSLFTNTSCFYIFQLSNFSTFIYYFQIKFRFFVCFSLTFCQCSAMFCVMHASLPYAYEWSIFTQLHSFYDIFVLITCFCYIQVVDQRGLGALVPSNILFR